MTDAMSDGKTEKTNSFGIKCLVMRSMSQMLILTFKDRLF